MREHLVAERETRYLLADRGDDTCRFDAECQRWLSAHIPVAYAADLVGAGPFTIRSDPSGPTNPFATNVGPAGPCGHCGPGGPVGPAGIVTAPMSRIASSAATRFSRSIARLKIVRG